MIPVATLEPVETPEGEEPELTPVRGLPKRRRDCRWEEAKMGLVQKPGEVEGRLYSARPTGELDESFDDLLTLAWLKGWTEQTQVRGIADGARHIRPRMEEVFNAGPFRFILDRPHCQEHLSTAGELLEAESALDEGVAPQQYGGATQPERQMSSPESRPATAYRCSVSCACGSNGEAQSAHAVEGIPRRPRNRSPARPVADENQRARVRPMGCWAARARGRRLRWPTPPRGGRGARRSRPHGVGRPAGPCVARRGVRRWAAGSGLPRCRRRL